LLVRLLRDDPSESVRAAAAKSLGRFVLLGEVEKIEAAPAMMVENALLGAIYDPHETLEVRRRAVESISYTGQAPVRDIIEMAYCDDEDEVVRSQAIEGLWEDEDLALAGLLVRLLGDDPSESVRVAAAISLGRFVLLGELEKIQAAPAMMVENGLLGAIYDPHETLEVHRRAVESIAYSGQAQVRDIIEMAYCDDEEQMRISAVFAMGRNADPIWREMVTAELDHPNPEMRYEAARACGELEASAALSALIYLIEADPDSEVQEMAIWALGRIGGKEARRVLEACCESEDEALRQAAEEALDELDFLGGHLDLLLFESDDWTDEG
jgi:HEAT repeat protein